MIKTSESGKINPLEVLDKILDLIRDLVEVEIKSDIGKINYKFGVIVGILFFIFIFIVRDAQAIIVSFLSVIAFFSICVVIVVAHDLRVLHIKKYQLEAKYNPHYERLASLNKLLNKLKKKQYKAKYKVSSIHNFWTKQTIAVTLASFVIYILDKTILPFFYAILPVSISIPFSLDAIVPGIVMYISVIFSLKK